MTTHQLQVEDLIDVPGQIADTRAHRDVLLADVAALSDVTSIDWERDYRLLVDELRTTLRHLYRLEGLQRLLE